MEEPVDWGARPAWTSEPERAGEMTPLRRRMIEDMRVRNFSEHTIDAYVRRVATFAKHYQRSPEHLGREEIREFLVHLRAAGVSYFVLQSFVSAFRFFYAVTVGRREGIAEMIPAPKPERKLPVVLSRDEVHALLGALTNLKHRTILSVCYGAGLRVAEVTHLQVADIDSQRMMLRVRRGKGRKDRFVPLSPVLLERLREYWRAYQPPHWLFPGAEPDKPIHPRSVMRICARARKAAKLKKPATPHTLRHSYATHLLEAGINIRVIQRLLGHRNLNSTALYTHVSAAQNRLSPLDLLDPAV